MNKSVFKNNMIFRATKLINTFCLHEFKLDILKDVEDTAFDSGVWNYDEDE